MRGVLDIWTIYDHPRDYPDGFIARRFEVGSGEHRPTLDVLKADTLEELQTVLQRRGMVCIPRSPGDERQIVESWI